MKEEEKDPKKKLSNILTEMAEFENMKFFARFLTRLTSSKKSAQLQKRLSDIKQELFHIPLKVNGVNSELWITGITVEPSGQIHLSALYDQNSASKDKEQVSFSIDLTGKLSSSSLDKQIPSEVLNAVGANLENIVDRFKSKDSKLKTDLNKTSALDKFLLQQKIKNFQRLNQKVQDINKMKQKATQSIEEAKENIGKLTEDIVALTKKNNEKNATIQDLENQKKNQEIIKKESSFSRIQQEHYESILIRLKEAITERASIQQLLKEKESLKNENIETTRKEMFNIQVVYEKELKVLSPQLEKARKEFMTLMQANLAKTLTEPANSAVNIEYFFGEFYPGSNTQGVSISTKDSNGNLKSIIVSPEGDVISGNNGYFVLSNSELALKKKLENFLKLYNLTPADLARFYIENNPQNSTVLAKQKLESTGSPRGRLESLSIPEAWKTPNPTTVLPNPVASPASHTDTPMPVESIGSSAAVVPPSSTRDNPTARARGRSSDPSTPISPKVASLASDRSKASGGKKVTFAELDHFVNDDGTKGTQKAKASLPLRPSR